MAVLYSRNFNGHQYEVRSAGKTRRLYTDGVFHSQYHPDHAVTGSVWDLLFLPSLLAEPGTLKRVLVLGVGGGAVIHMLNRFVNPEQIVGIELSAIHLQVARRHFDLRYPNLQLVQADAIQWLIQYNGEPFDLIIDDLYFEDQGQPTRAIAADGSWFDILMEHLTEQGQLVLNFVSQKEWRECGYFTDDFVKEHFVSALRFATPTCHNVVAALFPRDVTPAQLRKRLREFPELDERKAACRLRYSVSRTASKP